MLLKSKTISIGLTTKSLATLQYKSSFNLSSSSSSLINVKQYSTTTSTLPPPFIPPTEHHDNSNNENNQSGDKKKKNYNKYIVLGTAGFVLPICFLSIDNNNNNNNGPIPPPSGSSPTKPAGMLISQTIDVQQIYQNQTTSELMFSYFILKLCTIQYLSDKGSDIIHLAERMGLSKPMYWVVKKTFFKHFCAGETIEETDYFANRLHQQGIGAILDYSVEDQEGTPESFDHVASQIKKTIELSSKYPNLSFSCVKVTGLTNPNLLEKLNTIAQTSTVKITDIESLKNPKSIYRNATTLTSQEIKELDELVDRLDGIFKECHRLKIPILVDAEQSYYQHTIHHLTMAFSYKYNTEKPLIYNTYQMYLVSGIDTLNHHLLVAKDNGFKLGAKIVRGAYMSTERARAARLNQSDPILPNIQETHHSYFTAMETLLGEIARRPNDVGIMVASHNEQSVSYGSERIKQLGIDNMSPNIQFGQLFGMADYLTHGLVSQNQRVFKYVPYGPVKDVLPYLVRRMQENKGFIGSNSATELAFLKKEIKRRLLSPFN